MVPTLILVGLVVGMIVLVRPPSYRAVALAVTIGASLLWGLGVTSGGPAAKAAGTVPAAANIGVGVVLVAATSWVPVLLARAGSRLRARR